MGSRSCPVRAGASTAMANRRGETVFSMGLPPKPARSARHWLFGKGGKAQAVRAVVGDAVVVPEGIDRRSGPADCCGAVPGHDRAADKNGNRAAADYEAELVVGEE